MLKQLKFNHQTITINYRDDSDLSVIDEIFVDRMYRSTESLISNIQYPILDIGAHIGLFSIYASILNPKVKIIALEPEPNNFALMKENLKLNHCKNVVVKQTALVACHSESPVKGGEESLLSVPKNDSSVASLPQNNKTTTLYLNANSHNHTTSLQHHNTSTPEQLIVPATTLEQLITKNKLSKIGLLKMDIEGGEFEVIKTLKPENIKTIVNMAIEYHELLNNNRADLENIIRSHGFSVEHFPNHFDKRFGLLVCRNKKFSTEL